MIHPHLLYGIVIWANTYEKHLKKLNILQNKAVRFVTGAVWRDHIMPCYLKMNILGLNELRMYEVAKLMHKHTLKKLSTNLYLSNYNLLLPRCKTQKLQNSFRCQGVKVGNSLPQNKKCYHLTNKNKYRKYLLSNYE